MSWVLDASASLCWLKGERGYLRMQEVLSAGDARIIHAVNHVEVQYTLRRLGERALQLGLERMRAVGIEVARDMNDQFLARAARLKVDYAPIALGDTFAVARAVERDATLLTTDRGELEKVALAGVCRIEFLR